MGIDTRRMRAGLSRRHNIAAALAFAAVAAAAACGGKIDAQDRSDAGSRTPTPTPSATASTSPTATPTATATPLPPVAQCDSSGLSTSTAPCAVSFTQTIFAYMAPAGEWACSNGNCHGASGPSGTSVNAPTIDGTDPHAAYASLTSFTNINDEPYINGCSVDPNASSMLCNLNGTCSPTMPQSGAGVNAAFPVSASSLRDLQSWLACGAPFN